jgi:hypothetical protein
MGYNQFILINQFFTELPSDCKCKIKEGNIMESRTPFIWNKWYSEPSGYAENLDNWIFL